MWHLFRILLGIAERFLGVFTGLTVGGSFFAMLIGTSLTILVLKVLDLFALGIVTFVVTDNVTEMLGGVINSYVASIDFGVADVTAMVLDLMDTMGLDTAFSILVSAISINMTLTGYKWATSFNAPAKGTLLA